MFENVFILGAGASKCYGFPLGIELRRKIVRGYAEVLPTLAKKINDPRFEPTSIKFIDNFTKSGDMSIDLFLSKFDHFADVGKIAILYHILNSENKENFLDQLFFKQQIYPDSSNDDWLWYLYSKITAPIQISKNIDEINFDNIAFITFNYDRSLEYFLYERFSNGFNYKKIGGSPQDLIKKIRIEHVYGQVAPLPWQDLEVPKIEYGEYNINNHNLTPYINSIKIIGERTSDNINQIQNLIKQAKNIFFLGFGYDQENLNRLGIPMNINSNQHIYGTAKFLIPEQIDEIVLKTFIARHNRGYGTHLKQIHILNCDCTLLLKKYY